jgi:hypothetical protein
MAILAYLVTLSSAVRGLIKKRINIKRWEVCVRKINTETMKNTQLKFDKPSTDVTKYETEPTEGQMKA